MRSSCHSYLPGQCSNGKVICSNVTTYASHAHRTYTISPGMTWKSKWGSTIEAPYLKAYISLFSVHWPLPKGVHTTIQWEILRLQYKANYWLNVARQPGRRNIELLAHGPSVMYPESGNNRKIFGSDGSSKDDRKILYKALISWDSLRINHLGTSPADSSMQIKHIIHTVLRLHCRGPESLHKVALEGNHVHFIAGSYDQTDQETFD